MEKLEPIIRHKFWIIFGLTLPIALFAYYSASGEMADATTTQEEKLKSTLSSVPKGVSEPNQTYADGAKEINEELQKEFDEQVQRLWVAQTDRMTWPPIVLPFVPDQYRGEIDSKARYTYQRAYSGVIRQLWERVQPYVGESSSNRTQTPFKAEWPEKVIIDGHKIPAASFDMTSTATNKEIWDAQEDIWLLEMIFDAVVRTNADAQFVSDAPVRQIDKIELRGGTGESSVTSSGSAGGSSESGMGEDMYEDYEGGMGLSAGGAGGMGGGMGPGGMGGTTKIDFSPAEEFGPQVPEASEGEESASSGSGMEEEMYSGAGLGGMYGGARGAKMQRYIGPAGMDPFEGPYRERGFYMSVIILQDRIPEFLAELSSSPWPIRIGRFQIGKNPHAQQARGTGGGFGMAFGGGIGGMEGYDDYGMEDYGADGGMLGGFGGSGMGGFGGMGMGPQRSTLKLPDYMKMPSSIPDALRSHPDLVQMDLCGIVTMYNPVTSDEVEATGDGSDATDYEEEIEQTAETPEEAQAMAAEAAAEEAAAEAAGITADPNAAADDAAVGDDAPEDGAPPDPAAETPEAAGDAPADGAASPEPEAESQQ